MRFSRLWTTLIVVIHGVWSQGAGDFCFGQDARDPENRRRPASERRQGRGAADRSTLPPDVVLEEGIEYAKVGDQPLRLAVLRPAKPAATARAAIVFFHGGGWRNGDELHNLPRLVRFAQNGGYVCFSVGYRLSREATWPAQIHDCKAAIRFLRANAPRFRIDPERIGVIGPSAGGHLAAMIGTCQDPSLEGTLGVTSVSSKVRCAVALCPATDLVDWGGAPSEGARQNVDQLLSAAWGTAPERALTASPIHFVSGDDPPFLVVHSKDDPAIPFVQASRFAEKLKSSGVDVTLVPVESNQHGVTLMADGRQRIEAFLARHLLGEDVTVASDPIVLPKRESQSNPSSPDDR